MSRLGSAAPAPAPDRVDAPAPVAALRAFENLLADISAGFVNRPAPEVDAAIVDALRRCVALLDVDRAVLLRFLDDDRDVLVSHAWAVSGVDAPAVQPIGALFPWAWERLKRGVPVVAPRIRDLPDEAATDRANWLGAGVRSNLTMPLRAGGRVSGALAFGCLRGERDWPEHLVDRVRVLADVFANALAHKQAQEALAASIGFEQLVSEILAALLTAAPGELDRVLDSALADLAFTFGAERATLWRRAADRQAFVKAHRWLAPGVPAPAESVEAAALPWMSARLIAGEIVRFGRIADLPPEAAADLPLLGSLGVRAAVFVPLTVGGAVTGALSFATVSDDRDWPDALVPRVQLVGDVFAAVLARQAAERREREAQMHAAHAARVGMIGAFAASLVHELTQPIAASLANAETLGELLAPHAPDLAEARTVAADILRNEHHAGALIQQLRSFLRRTEMRRERLAPAPMIAEAAHLLRKDAEAKGIELALDIAPALPEVMIDRVQIEQVLLNLLLNAFDAVAAAGPAGRRVCVTVQAAADALQIEVADTGPGMDAVMLERVFEPFFTTKPGGMGLGLSISRTIAAAHGGTLDVRSAPGAGTTFTLALPAAAVAEASAAEPGAPAHAAAAEGATVCVIDDEPSMRRALERQLESAGYRVRTYSSAQEYLASAPEAGLACVVSDVRMPGASGLDLQASLAAGGRELPVVFMSGHGDVATTVSAMKAGAVDFLSKPFTKAQLLAAVAAALGQARAQAASRREAADLRERYAALTPREREVFELVAAGTLNKVIGDRLGVTEHTVKIHRGRVMEKLGAGSVADLVRMAARLSA